MVAGRVRQVVVLCSNNVWKLAWTDSILVLLDEWLSYGGGRISRFDCMFSSSNLVLNIANALFECFTIDSKQVYF